MRLIDADVLEKRFEYLETFGNELAHKVTDEEKGRRIAYHLAKYETHVAPTIVDTGSLRSQWIPVTERLPDYDPDPGERFPMLIIFTKRDGVTPGLYNECTKKWFACELRTCVFAETAEEDVIAWMPLPDAYEPENVEKED